MAQQIERADPSKVDVVFHITEGQQIFVRKVLLTGLHYTRPETVAKAITLHPGDPLNQTALMETQRNLYDFALFNEIDTAIENPTGGETNKTVLLQAAEARRWALTYGFGFEAQTGTPQYNCGGIIASGVTCNPNGKTGVSPRVLADITRNNLFGREQSASLRGNLRLAGAEDRSALPESALRGQPELRPDLLRRLRQQPGCDHLCGLQAGKRRALDRALQYAGLASSPRPTPSSMNSTSAASRWRPTACRSIPARLQLLSTAVRVAGPALTWIRDTRDSPLDAHRGTYTSFQEFLSGRGLRRAGRLQPPRPVEFQLLRLRQGPLCAGPQHALRPGAGLWQAPADELIPLPERLYAGGATSLRGFGSNSAGPRDPETGYPIGGAGALINSTELRLPPPTLPWLGNTVSFVLFHDMGNVFTNAGDAWASALRVRQPERDNCKTADLATDPAATLPPAP